MKLNELSKDELVDLTTQLLKNIGAYPMAEYLIHDWLLVRWNKKRKALEQKAKCLNGIENFRKWEKVQKEMDNPKNDIDYCTHLDELENATH